MKLEDNTKWHFKKNPSVSKIEMLMRNNTSETEIQAVDQTTAEAYKSTHQTQKVNKIYFKSLEGVIPFNAINY